MIEPAEMAQQHDLSLARRQTRYVAEDAGRHLRLQDIAFRDSPDGQFQRVADLHCFRRAPDGAKVVAR